MPRKQHDQPSPPPVAGTAAALGVVYTPAAEVEFLCRACLAEYLAGGCQLPQDAVLRLLTASPGGDNAAALSMPVSRALYQALASVRVLDPACGDGAFLLGMARLLLDLRARLAAVLGRRLDAARERRRIAGQSLYGVDVSATALDAARQALPQLNLLQGDGVLPRGAAGGVDWAAAFSGVMGRHGGFDIVIGNPPYVRHELIRDPRPGGVDARRYKGLLARALREDWGAAAAHDAKSDYYMYFIWRGLKLLKPRGCLGFLTANAWLDAQFGRPLRELFARRARSLAVFDCAEQRSFADAVVNTVAVVAALGEGEGTEVNGTVATFSRLPAGMQYGRTQGARVCRVSAAQLQRHEAEYGGRWGALYLRAPAVFWEIVEHCGGRLTQLGELAALRRGYTTGANGFFYLRVDDIAASRSAASRLAATGPAAELMPVRNALGWRGLIEQRYLAPAVRSPRELSCTLLDEQALEQRVFLCRDDERELAGTQALKYIRWGAAQLAAGHQLKQPAGSALPSLPSLAARTPWYALPERAAAALICCRFFHERLFFTLAPGGVLLDQTLYGGRFAAGVDPQLQTALLNSTLQALLTEIFGRSALGEGALQYSVADMQRLPCLDARRSIAAGVASLLREAWHALCRRPIAGIPRELGITAGPAASLARLHVRPAAIDPARRALDAVVWEQLGLDARRQQAVYDALARLVLARLRKAASLR